MSRDHRKLRAFVLADDLVIDIYKLTSNMPVQERYGLTSQIRRATISVPTNIVEGCARPSQSDFVRFLNISFGSLRETAYLLGLCVRLNYLKPDSADPVLSRIDECSRVLSGLIKSLT